MGVKHCLVEQSRNLSESGDALRAGRRSKAWVRFPRPPNLFKEHNMDREKHNMRIGWFWSVVGGICAITFVFAISNWIDNTHEEWMRCYEMREKSHKNATYFCR